MRIQSGLYSILFIILFSGMSFSAEIAEELKTRLDNSYNDELIEVWLVLPKVTSNKSQSEQIASSFTSRADRHKEIMHLLKETHQTAQKDILTHLNQSYQKSNRMIKSHWLVNVIEVLLTKEEIQALAVRTDIEIIYEKPEIRTIAPEVDIRKTDSKAAAIESNLTYINAPAAWGMGYTGAGRVVCSFDTGVDGNHPALNHSWKGKDGDSLAAWFDPAKNQLAPHHIPDCGYTGCNTNHGTHTMGTMVGINNSTGDTVGVAPEAKWISAAVIDVAGTSIIDAFEWAADPDRNPNTVEDVPDVINHSWGVIGIDCEDIFYDMIEYTEALGIVNIFSAGNEGGSGTSTIRNPANRALDSLDCFAIGNIDENTDNRYSASSQGPSDCPPGEIKPNVSAPGTSIRSTIPNNNYGFMTGTSMAAPHVSGLVALLRQKNPNATVDEIKTAILMSSGNLGQFTPNNQIGWGVINCVGALNALNGTNAAPNIRVYSFDHPAITPGDDVYGTIVLQNLGDTDDNVVTTLLNTNSALTVLSGVTTYGTITEGDTVRSASSVGVTVSDTVTVGTVLSIDMKIESDNLTDTVKLYFIVDPLPERSFVTHNVGDILFSLTNYGTFGLAPATFFPIGGAGFNYLNVGNELYEGGLMIGTGSGNVSDGVRNLVGEPDGDFSVLPGGDIIFVTPRPGVSQQSSARFSDSRANIPYGLNITQNSYAFANAPYSNIIILQYIISNPTASAVNGLYVGLYMDWDVNSYSSNSGGYEAADDFSWIAYYNGVSSTGYRGVKVLTPMTVTSSTENATVAYYPASGDGYTEAEKLASLSAGTASANTYKTSSNDLLQVTAAQISLSAGQTDTVAFALIAGTSFGTIQTAASEATALYNGPVTDVDDFEIPDNLPAEFVLTQNYPNPFNPATTVQFMAPTISDYTFEIFNLTGQRVFTKKSKTVIGMNEIVWDAEEYSSGMYLYRLTTGSFTDSKKMILLK